jgi:hypothetical protein
LATTRNLTTNQETGNYQLQSNHDQEGRSLKTHAATKNLAKTTAVNVVKMLKKRRKKQDSAAMSSNCKSRILLLEGLDTALTVKK